MRDRPPCTIPSGLRSGFVLVQFHRMVETLGDAFDAGWMVEVRCGRRRAGLKSVRACTGRQVLAPESMLWTHGRAFPVALLPDRLKCPSCGTRHVLVVWIAPGMPTRRTA